MGQSDDLRSTREARLAGMLAILATLLAFGNISLGYAAVGYSPPPDTFSNVSASLPITGIDASLLRWSTVCDLFGYYLFLSPLILVWSSRMDGTGTPFRRLATYCGLGYVLVGAVAAVALLSNAIPLIDGYALASDIERPAIQLAYETVNNVVNGMWNLLGVTLGGVWWLTLGSAIRRERPVLGILSIILGIAAWLDALGSILLSPLLFAIGLAGVLLLIPIWSLAFGVALLRSA